MRQRLEVLEGLSDDLFLSVKLENHELAFVFDEVCLNDLLTHLAEAHQVSARQKQIRMNLILPKQAIWVWADDLRLQRVFDNLLRNALAHTPEGGQIDCVCSIKGEQIEIRIQDTEKGSIRRNYRSCSMLFILATSRREAVWAWQLPGNCRSAPRND